MLQFDPTDPEELAFTLHKAVKKSGLPLVQIAERLEQEYGLKLTESGLTRISHSPVKTRVFSIQDVNEPGTHQRKAFIRANAPVLVLSDASGVCFSVTF